MQTTVSMTGKGGFKEGRILGGFGRKVLLRKNSGVSVGMGLDRRTHPTGSQILTSAS